MKMKIKTSVFPKRYLQLLLVMTMLVLPVSCTPSQEPTFPQLPKQQETSEMAPEATGTNNSNIVPGTVLRLAVPLGEDAAELLRLLFSGRLSGDLVLDEANGAGRLLQLDDLAEYDLPWQIELESVSWSSGADRTQIAQWKAAADLPDIIYSRRAAADLDLINLLELSPYLSGSELIKPDRIYSGLLEGAIIENHVFGVPYLASVPLLIYRQDWLDSENIALPQGEWNWQQLSEIALQVQMRLDETGKGISPDILETIQENSEISPDVLTEALITLGNPLELMHYLPAQINRESGALAWKEDHFALAGQSGQEAYSWLEKFVHRGLSAVHLDEPQRELADLQNMSQIARRSIFWIADSSDLAWWHQQEGISPDEKLLPRGAVSWPEETVELDTREDNCPDNNAQTADDARFQSRLPVSVRYLTVSRSSEYPGLAADLAAFLALDNDSLLIQSRFQLYEGLFPAVRSELVWNAMVARQPYSTILMDVKELLDCTFTEPAFTVPDYESAVEKAHVLLQELLYDSLLTEENIAERLKEIDQIINQVLRGE